MKINIVILIFTFLMQSCKNNTFESNQNIKKGEIKENILKTENAEEWLRDIFKCKNQNEYCFYTMQIIPHV